VRIGGHLPPQSIRPHFGRPVLSERDEKLLIAGKAVDPRHRLPAQRAVIGLESRRHAAEIGNVLVDRLPPVDPQPGQSLVGIVLIFQSLGLLLEVLAVRRGPPVAQAPLRIEGAAFRIEGVTDLVADDGADRAVIVRRGSLRAGVPLLKFRCNAQFKRGGSALFHDTTPLTRAGERGAVAGDGGHPPRSMV
jgi:hypothetical protein